MTQQTKDYGFVKSNPVAKFFYRGDHTHPVRRTVLVVKSDEKVITGYELREGSVTRKFKNAPIKSFRRDRIAKASQLDKRRVLVRKLDSNKTTLKRFTLKEIVKNGA